MSYKGSYLKRDKLINQLNSDVSYLKGKLEIIEKIVLQKL